MKINCKLCGGSNEIYPDEKVTRCAYCGGTIAIEDNQALKKLILVHKRDDSKAGEALRSFVLKTAGSKAECGKIEFFYIPFSRNNTGRVLPSVAADERFKNIKVLQPYGIFVFLEDFLNSNTGTEIPHTSIVESDDRVSRIEGTIYIPVYEIKYSTTKYEGTAYVVGETWQVIAEPIAEKIEPGMEPAELKLPATLFVIFFALSFTVHGTLSRLLLVALSGAIAHLLLYFKERGPVPWKSRH